MAQVEVDGDNGILTSLRAYDALRWEQRDQVTRLPGTNLDILDFPLPLVEDTEKDTDEDIILICHLVNIKPLTRGDYVLQKGEVEDFTALLLGAHHLNTGNGVISPQVQDLHKRCPIRFTVETGDTQFSPGLAVNEVVARTSRSLPERLPCAFVGAYRSAVSIPTAILTGVFGYPQISPGSVSTQLDDTALFPLFGRTLPSDGGNAVAVLRYFTEVLQLQNLAVLHVNDAYGNSFVDSLRKAALQYAGPEFAIHQVPLDQEEGSVPIAIRNIKESDFTVIFCIVFTTQLHDAILEEAVLQDVAGNGLHNWFFGNTFVGILNDRTVEKDGPLHKAYQGTGIIESTGGVPGIPSYDRFAQAMQELKNPTDLHYIESLLPDYNQTEYPQYNKDLLYQDTMFQPITNVYAPFSYEAAIALGLSACQALETYGRQALFTGQQHFDTFKTTTFDAVSGKLVFDNVTGTRDQKSGTYKVANFLTEDAGTDPETGKPLVRFVLPITNLFLKGEWRASDDNAFIFNDGTTNLPSGLAPQLLQDDSNNNLGLAVGLALALAVAVVSGLIFLVYYKLKQKQRDDSVWKVDKNELQFSDPPQVLGQGSFGEVLLAEYRGTLVAVKKVLPPKANLGTSHQTVRKSMASNALIFVLSRKTNTWMKMKKRANETECLPGLSELLPC